MTALALALILVSAGLHAGWNLLAKRSGGGAVFVWLFCALSALFWAPLAVGFMVWQQPHLGPGQIGFMGGSVLLHLAYFLTLQKGYQVGDLSLVYPLARGTGPLLSTIAAMAFFAERPTPLALLGALAVVVGVFVMAGGGRAFSGSSEKPRWAVRYGLLTGGLIAAYTLWDKHAVSALLLPPILLNWGNDLGRTLLLSPLAVQRWGEVREEWRKNRLEAIGIAILSPLSYILVLTALKFTPVSYVAPAREVSILIGAVLGARFLAEGEVRRRLWAASGMVLGVVFLALG
ncbi:MULTISPECIES: EamA family transporter [unclassified Meiothermus]|uniref:EamA family transporter n=1 Tax=unclassified Meiothermus TaxID=370471 RepID=UPI000D7CE494|nr:MULTISPECIES: EamA family transporter [unclassified Meiothermus]PZA08580.1 EamA family transporter [Meiothermus sp. Pnk-1]RYM40803.1 EamA family transporter [Meiothermus sp. PNK-Is4]